MASQSRPGQPPAACDQCYARKVKCDRGDPCINCTNTNTVCIRARPMRVPRRKTSPNDNNMRNVIERLSQLQDSLTKVTSSVAPRDSAPASTTSPASGAPDAAADRLPSPMAPRDSGTANSLADETSTPQRSKRPRNGEPGPTSDSSPNAAPVQTPQCSEAQSFILQELTSGTDISVNRRVVLESAFALISQMSHSPGAASELIDDSDDADTLHLSVPEPVGVGSLHTMLNDNKSMTPRRVYTYEYTFWITPASVERMGIALLEKNGSTQTLLQYTVCVHYKACWYLSSLSHSQQSPSMQKHMRQQTKRHMDIALAALNRVSVTAAPSLSLLQTLVSGASMLQYQGKSAKCWNLIAQACAVIKALGWHLSTSFTFDSDNKAENEILLTVLITYCLDKSFSMNLGRPVNLSGLQFLSQLPIDRLIEGPFSVIVEGLYLLARAQESIIEKLQTQPPNNNEVERAMVVQSITAQLAEYKTKSSNIEYRPEIEEDGPLKREFLVMNFVCHSILTAALRYHPRFSQDSKMQEECLNSAREVFISMKKVKEGLGTPEDSFDLYAIIISWSLMIYPLSPYLVLFCNVIATSNIHDFQLMQDIVDIISPIAKAKASVARLYRLCTTFINLCLPLIGKGNQIVEDAPPALQTSGHDNSRFIPLRSNGSVTASMGASHDMHHAKNPFRPPVGYENGAWSSSLPSSETTQPNGAVEISAEVASMWDKGLMWQLLQTQPSLNWLNNEAFSADDEFQS